MINFPPDQDDETNGVRKPPCGDEAEADKCRNSWRRDECAYDVKSVVDWELEIIKARRKKCGNPADAADAGKSLFGIALSGGGVRAATVSMGFLKVLNDFCVLSKADYLSSVSGGGYAASYVHAKLNVNRVQKNPYETLFIPGDINHIKNKGEYLAPGKGFTRKLNRMRLAGAFVFSLLMNWIWVILFALFVLYLFKMREPQQSVFSLRSLMAISGVVLLYHFFINPFKKIWSSNLLNYLEGILVSLIAITLFWHATDLAESSINRWMCLHIPYASEVYNIICKWVYHCFVNSDPHTATEIMDKSVGLYVKFFAAYMALIVSGFFANPNVLSMHRFYMDRLAECFLEVVGKGAEDIKLTALVHGEKPLDGCCAPYPLINSCVNLFGYDDKGFAGIKASDYFLLSPLFCGSKLTSYIPSSSADYDDMTLKTAAAISGAALNPQMGMLSNRALGFLMALFNLKLGYWALNPRFKGSRFRARFTFWNLYNVANLLGISNLNRWRVNLSDGGHIENLGVFELLRRRCKLIIALDAATDPDYHFEDLSGLVQRARNELGMSITFRQKPEEFIRPEASFGFSRSHFVVADIRELPRAAVSSCDDKCGGAHIGLLIYVKSSVRPHKTFGKNDCEGKDYKRFHPAFPHEPLVDQFFDPEQWSAYYNLGRFIAGDVLGMDITGNRDYFPKSPGRLNGINNIYDWFDKFTDGDFLEDYLKRL
jgi:hypothetical protein